MDKKDAFVVGNYAFETLGDAALADTERKKVDYLRHHLDTSHPETVLALYNKLIKDRMFKTPIGWLFETELRDYLLSADYSENEVPPVPLHHRYTESDDRQGGLARKRVEPESQKEKKRVSPLFVSVVINIALVIAVIAMFYITMHSDQPNILNYEKAIVNQYSFWEKELTAREQVIREKERELNLGDGQ